MALLHDKYFSCQVACLFLLVITQVLYTGVYQKAVSELVNLVLADIRQLVHISVYADIPALFGPVTIGPKPRLSAHKISEKSMKILTAYSILW